MAFKKSTWDTSSFGQQGGQSSNLYTFEVDGGSSSKGGFPVLSFGAEPKEFETTWSHPSQQGAGGGFCSGLPSQGQGFSWDRLVEMEIQTQNGSKS
jgi:hypothetical protein